MLGRIVFGSARPRAILEHYISISERVILVAHVATTSWPPVTICGRVKLVYPDSRPAADAPHTNNIRLVAAVSLALQTTGYSHLRKLIVLEVDGLIVLQGRVPSYHMKQVAQASVMAVPGVQGLCNDLEVARRRQSSAWSPFVLL